MIREVHNTQQLDPVASHLCDPDQREEIATLGMWLFLSTEVLFFGGLFLGFAIYRMRYRDAFIAASGHLNVALGSTNTLILLTSSLFVALAVLASRRGERRRSTVYLMITVLLALVFLCIKFYEWDSEYHEKLVPGLNFSMPNAADAQRQQLFFCYYFIMTGIHALHMIIGTGVISWIILRGWQGKDKLSQTERIRIESTALFWHFVDIIWVFLLPLLYLTGLEKL